VNREQINRLYNQGYTEADIARMEHKEWAGKHLDTIFTSDYDEPI